MFVARLPWSILMSRHGDWRVRSSGRRFHIQDMPQVREALLRHYGQLESFGDPKPWTRERGRSARRDDVRSLEGLLSKTCSSGARDVCEFDLIH
jgi:hypothetical protein